MVKCHICGIEKDISIVEHLRHTHKLTVPEYRALYLNADVKSEKARRLISEQNKKVWQDEEYKRKMCKSRQISHRTEAFREAQSKRIKDAYNRGFKSWNTGLTKGDDNRIAEIGRVNSNHLTGRTKENYEYLRERSEKMKNDHSLISENFLYKNHWSENRRKEWKEKISKTVSLGLSEGKYKTQKKGYTKGWYQKLNSEKEYYESSWELKLMEYLDLINVFWTKKHRIIIPYIDEVGNQRRYVPDFLIAYNDKRMLLELKGFSRSDFEINAKKESAEIWAIENCACYRLCWTVEEAKLELMRFYEISENSKN